MKKFKVGSYRTIKEFEEALNKMDGEGYTLLSWNKSGDEGDQSWGVAAVFKKEIDVIASIKSSG